MKRALVALGLCLIFSTMALAHGNEEHVMGTVTSISNNSISVETGDKKTVTITIAADTKFIKSGSAASPSDLKVGDRVVVHAKKAGGKLTAESVRFGKTTTMEHHH